MKIATWNLMLPVSEKRRKAIRAYTDTQGADVWILTETHDEFTPGHAYSQSSAAGRDGQHGAKHRWVTIWSKYPITPLQTSDSLRTASVRITPPGEAPFVVYGTVLPWIGSAWRDYPSTKGTAFRAALALQTSDWLQIRRDFPEDELFLSGDFNQDLVHPRYYGSLANRAALEDALIKVGLIALTSGDGDPVRRTSAPFACIDHICARRDSNWRFKKSERWPDIPAPEKWLTDHFGISVQLESCTAQTASTSVAI